MSGLTPDAVQTIMRACLFLDDGEDRSGAIVAEGITRKFWFHPDRIKQYAGAIGELLAEMPEQFQADKGGGWSFLNACNDRHGRQWTGMHSTMEELFCLGIAAGKAAWLFPRDLWDALPGGAPYVAVNV